MNTNNNIPLVDILTTAEARLERKLAACMALHPKYVIEQANGFKPEVDQTVCKYWGAVLKRKAEIEAATDDEAFNILMGILLPKHEGELWNWWGALADENSYATISETINNLKGLRAIRKTVDFIQVNKIINETLEVYYG